MLGEISKRSFVLVATIISMFCGVLNAQAQGQATINLFLVDDLGNPIASPGYSSISCSGQGGVSGYNSIAQGEDHGSLTVSLSQSTTLTCSVFGVTGYGLPVRPQVTVAPNDTANADLVLAPLDATVHVVMRDQNGDPVLDPVGGYGSISCATQDYSIFFSTSLADGADSGDIDVLSGHTYRCTYGGSIDGYQAVQGSQITPNPGDELNYQISFAALDAGVTIELRDLENNFVPAPAGQWPFSIGCSSESAGYFSFTFDEGESSSTKQIIGGVTYSCYVSSSIPGYVAPASQFSLEVAPNGTLTHVVTYQALDATVRVNFTDSSGGAIALPENATLTCSWYSSQQYLSFYADISAGATSHDLQVLGGKEYSCSLTNMDSHSAVGYQHPEVDVGETENLSIAIVSLNSTLTIRLQDNHGNSIGAPSDSVSLSCSQTPGYQFSYYGQFGQGDTEKTFNVVGGQSYYCSAYGFGDTYGSASVTVLVPDNSQTVAIMQLTSLDAQLTINLVDANGNALNLSGNPDTPSVSCWNQSGGPSVYASGSDAQDTAISLAVVGGTTYTCSSWGTGDYQFDYSSNNSVVVPSNGSGTLNLVHKYLGVPITVNLKDSSGNPVAVPAGSQYPNVNCFDSNGWYSTQLSEGDTSAVVKVPGDSHYTCSAYGLKGYTIEQSAAFSVAQSAASVDLVATALDAKITISLVHDGEAYTVPLGSWGWVYCSDSSYEFYFGASMEPGTSSVELDVRGATNRYYRCGLSLPSAASQAGEVLVEQGAQVSLPLTILSKDATIIVRTVDEDGNLITDLPGGGAYAYSIGSDTQDYANGSFSGGEATLDVVGGISYGAGAYFDGNSNGNVTSLSGVTYVVSQQSQTVSPLPGGSATLNIQLVRSNATLHITAALGSDGPAAGAWIWVSEITDDPDTFGSYFGASTDETGVATINALAGKRFSIGVWYPDLNWIAPVPVEVTLSENETKDVSLTFSHADYTLTVTPTAADATSGDAFCWAYTTTGLYTWGDAIALGSSGTLALSAGTWHVGCYGYLAGADAISRAYYSEAVELVVAEGETSGSVGVALISSGVEAFTETQSGDGGQVLETQTDAIHVQFPAGSVGDEGQTVELTIDNIPDSPVPDQDDVDQFPGAAYDLDITADGNPVDEFNQPVTIDFNVEGENLNPDDIVVEEFANGTFTEIPHTTETNNSFRMLRRADATTSVTVNVSVRRINGTIVLGARKGGAGDADPTPTPDPEVTPPPTSPDPTSPPSATPAPGKPTGVKAKVAKNGKLQISWKAASGSVDSYTVRIFAGKKQVFSRQVSASTLKLMVSKKLAVGKYKVEVTASNSSGSASASKKLNLKTAIGKRTK